MPLPTPRSNEEEGAFIQRCVPDVLESEGLDADSEDDRQQAVAICYSQWREAQKPKGKGRNQMEYKSFPGLVTKADEERGIIEAVFAVFGNVDGGRDIAHPGMFTKTFAECGLDVRVLDSHRKDSIMRAIGRPLSFREVGRNELPDKLLRKCPEANGGARAEVQMLMDTPEGKGAFIRLRDGAVTHWSFGYDPLDVDYSTAVKDGKEITVRNLRTVKLYEISPVLFSMNDAAMTVSAKGDNSMVEEAEGVKAEWTTAYVNDLPDSSFFYIALGGEKDEDGKTVPRNLRYFPYKDANGKVDLPHLRNAIVRIPQSNAPGLTDTKKEALQERARRLLEQEQEKAAEPTEEMKIGRTLSAANVGRIRTAIDGIQRQLQELEDLLTSTAPLEEPGQQELETEPSAPAKAQAAPSPVPDMAGPGTTPPTAKERLGKQIEILELEFTEV